MRTARVSCRNSRRLLAAFFILAVFIFTGCGAPLREELPVYEGGVSVEDSLSLLKARSGRAVPMRAVGQCQLQYYDEKERKTETFNVKVWVNPPDEIYLQGDVAFDPKGIVLGSNEREFWLAMKPKDLSSYWWGKWEQQSGIGAIMIDPKLMLEAFGIYDVANGKAWAVLQEGNFEVLTKQINGVERQKIYLSNSDGLVRKSVYLDEKEKVAALIELDRYRKVSDGLFVPALIKIITFLDSETRKPVVVTLKLSSIKSASLTVDQKSELFKRKEPSGFENIYKIIGGDILKLE